MMVLINGGGALDRFGPSKFVGRLTSPRSGTAIKAGERWAGDNDAFLAWDDRRFLKMLNRLEGTPGCLFVAVPDVVGDARKTLERFWDWRPEVAGRGFPVALVAQDGIEDMDIEWSTFDALFVGGSTAWKLSAAAAEVAAEARARGKWLHVGRVNTQRRMRIADALHADSIDGSGWSKFPDDYLKRDLPYLARINRQPRLF